MKRVVTRSIAEVVSVARIIRPERFGLRILNYHSIGGSALGDAKAMFSISQPGFRKHIRLLENYHIIPLLPLGVPVNSLQVAVTFDDGYLDNLTVAAPMLIERGIPFTVFVSSAFIKNRIHGFLAPEDLRELAALPGVTIGAHGKTHRPLTSCNDEELQIELADSKYYLEDLLGCSVTAVAYPFGAADMRVRNAAQQFGYELGLTTRVDINTPERDRLMLCRQNVESDNTARVISQKLRGDWDWYRWLTPLKSQSGHEDC